MHVHTTVNSVCKCKEAIKANADDRLFQEQLGLVLQYADKLREVETSDVDAAAHALPIFDVLREDEPRDWFSAEEAVSNAPRHANNLFVVPKVVE